MHSSTHARFSLRDHATSLHIIDSLEFNKKCKTASGGFFLCKRNILYSDSLIEIAQKNQSIKHLQMNKKKTVIWFVYAVFVNSQNFYLLLTMPRVPKLSSEIIVAMNHDWLSPLEHVKVEDDTNVVYHQLHSDLNSSNCYFRSNQKNLLFKSTVICPRKSFALNRSKSHTVISNFLY